MNTIPCNSTARKRWIDVCRGIGMIFVLLGHNNPPFIKYIFGFHMPLFFILSGYLYKDSQTEEHPVKILCKISKRFLLPYILLSAVNLALHNAHIYILSADSTGLPRADIIKYIKGILLIQSVNMPDCGPMWFLPVTALALFIFYLIRKLPNIYLRAFILLIFAALSQYIDSLKGTLPQHCLFCVLLAVLFYEIGYLIKIYNILEHSFKPVKSSLIIIGLFVLGFLIIKVNPANPWIDLNDGRFGLVPLTLLGATSVTIGIMYLSQIIEKIIPRFSKAFSYIGVHSILLLAFDSASNSWGGSLFSILGITSFTWYQALILRSCILFVIFIIWQGLIHIIPNGKIRQFLNF